MTKKLINNPESCVPDMVEGMLLTGSLKKVEGFNVVVRGDIEEIRKDRVTIISGGGSGHEPAHAGYIGKGMLSGAALGNVFASPSVATVLAAIRSVASPKGVLVIVKNYTGDRLNFGMAIEQARSEGILARMLVVEDDCALEPGKGITGGRGVCGTVFVHKVAGACAEDGMSLDEVHEAAGRVADAMGTMGVAVSPCTLPGATATQAAAERLAGRTVEVGMGIHGEPGRETMDLPETQAADTLADIMLDAVLGKTTDAAAAGARLAVSKGDKVALMVNNLGATPALELLIVARRAAKALEERGLMLARAYVGSFMTSLDMGGVSMTVVRTSDDVLRCLDKETTAPAWVPSAVLDTPRQHEIPYKPSAFAEKVSGGAPVLGASVILQVVCDKLVALEPQLTEYDTVCGDGDCGIVMKAGAKGVLADMALHKGNEGDAATFCTGIADSVGRSMGGTSGALLELALRAMAANFMSSSTSTTATTGGADWSEAIAAGVQAMQFYGGATAGMRTMLDALVPAVAALRAGGGPAAAAEAAAAGAEATKAMTSLAGRSNYIDAEKMKGTPDPGAAAMAEAFQAAAASMTTNKK